MSKLKARFAEVPIPFGGFWVNEHYVNEIRQGKPLRESQDTGTRAGMKPVIDHVDYPTNIDHIRLGRDKEHLNDYGLHFAGDTMMIYSIDCRQRAGGDCVSDTLGHQLYVLEKLK